MTKISKVLIGLAIAMVASFASAANYYDSEDSCVAAGRAGKAVDYKPTGKSKGYGDARVTGLEKRPLEGDACVLLAAQPGKRWVFLKKGTIVYTNGAEIKMLGECQNDIFEAHFIKTAQEPAAGCTTNCAVTVVKEVLEITNVTRKCVVDGKEIAMVDGECKPNPIKVTLNTKVETNISSSCGSTCNTPAATPAQPVKKAEGCEATGDCHREANVTKSVARTDGLCVFPMRDTQTGKVYTVLLGTVQRQGMNLLVATKMADGRLLGVNINNKQTLMELLAGSRSSHVGDGRQSVQMHVKDCKVAERDFLSKRSFEWTAQQIGLPLSCEMEKSTTGRKEEYTSPRPQV